MKTACVIGGSGFLASSIIKILLENGYAVNTTVRDPGNTRKTSHLIELQKLGDLKIFAADLTDEASFHAPIAGCALVFHVATPVHFASDDPENDMINPAIQGVYNVFNACVKSNTVKRMVLTSSAAAVSINGSPSSAETIMDEKNWTDIEFLTSQKPPTWGYPASKTLAEKAAWKLAEENGIDLITIAPSLMAGESLTSEIPASVHLAMGLITKDDFLISSLKGMQILSGSISITHVQDVGRAHVYLAEKESASGRYVCCGYNTSVPELAKFLKKWYPQYDIMTDFGEFPSNPKVVLSSEKLVNEGFEFNYKIEEIYEETIGYFKKKGIIN